MQANAGSCVEMNNLMQLLCNSTPKFELLSLGEFLDLPLMQPWTQA
jgi:hypothetical protein